MKKVQNVSYSCLIDVLEIRCCLKILSRLFLLGTDVYAEICLEDFI